jgi:hypothetical protein
MKLVGEDSKVAAGKAPDARKDGGDGSLHPSVAA